MEIKNLEQQFEDAVWDIMGRIRKEVPGYTPTVFLGLMETYGIVLATKKVLAPNSLTYGFEKLIKHNKESTLSVESLVVQEQFQPLFSEKEVKKAQAHLDFGQQLRASR